MLQGWKRNMKKLEKIDYANFVEYIYRERKVLENGKD